MFFINIMSFYHTLGNNSSVTKLLSTTRSDYVDTFHGYFLTYTLA